MKDFRNDQAPDHRAEHRELDPDAVADYLRRHPDFFIEYEELLPELALPHHTGEHAISLVERQVSVLRSRNRDVRHRLNRLLDTARDNDRLFQKTQKLVLAILDQRDIDSMAEAVQCSLRDDYDVDACALLLFERTGLVAGQARVVPAAEARGQIGALLNARQPTCGHLRPEEIAYLFGQASQPVQSAAVVSLMLGGEPLGLLALGSFDAEYYRAGMGTMFLNYVAEVLNRAIARALGAD